MQGPAVAALCAVLSSVGLIASPATAQAVVAKERVAAQIAQLRQQLAAIETELTAMIAAIDAQATV